MDRRGRRTGVVAVGLACATALACASGCTDKLAPLTGTTSLRVELVSPADPGDEDNRLPDDARSVTIHVTALDTEGNTDTTFSGQTQVYAHFLGSLTPTLEARQPLATVQITNGVSDDTDVELPQAFGATYLWVEDGQGDDPTFATGTSPTLWYRDPYVSDIQRPTDEGSLDALTAAPLDNKQVRVSTSRYGADGRLVVTGVYAQGYTVSDSMCGPDGAPPCTTGDYDHVYVFSYSRPTRSDGGDVKEGDVIGAFTGAVSEFNGLTEIGFPQTFVADGAADEARVPDPVVIQPGWLSTRIEMERAEAALVEIDDATLCPLDGDYDTYAQWKLDLGKGCGNPVNIITQGQVNDFDPHDYVGQVLPRVVGALRPVNLGGFNVWIIYPRNSGDLALP